MFYEAQTILRKINFTQNGNVIIDKNIEPS